jgi:hypothetical protein
MIPTLKLEFSRVFSWKNVLIYLVVIIASFYFIFLGVDEYKQFLKKKSDFSRLEKEKFDALVNYEQYAKVGFRVLFEPSPLMVFFKKTDFVQNLEANVDSSEVVNIYNLRKGRNAFTVDENFGDLSGIVTIFGTFLMMFMGMTSFRRRDWIDFFNKRFVLQAIIARLLWLNLFFAFLFSISYLFPLSMGISFSPQELKIYVCFSLLSNLFLSFFFLLGVTISSIFKYHKKAVASVFIIWFVLVFLIPEVGKIHLMQRVSSIPSAEELNLEKLKILLSREREAKSYVQKMILKEKRVDRKKIQKIMKEFSDDFMKTGYTKNKRSESNFHDKVVAVIHQYEYRSNYLPVDFFQFISREASSKGYGEYLNFVDYILDLKDRFIRFYVYKRYESPDQKVESFVKSTENFYKSETRLPASFFRGLTFLAVYFFLLITLLVVLNRKKPEKFDKPKLPADLAKNSILFLLVNPERQREMFESFKDGTAAILDVSSRDPYIEDISLNTFIRFCCKQKGINRDEVIKNLKVFKINRSNLNDRLSSFKFEQIKKIVASIALAEKKDTIVINDFIKNEAREFENQFLKILSQVAATGKKIIYLSSDIYSPSSTFNGDIKIDSYKTFQVDPQTISLR